MKFTVHVKNSLYICTCFFRFGAPSYFQQSAPELELESETAAHRCWAERRRVFPLFKVPHFVLSRIKRISKTLKLLNYDWPWLFSLERGGIWRLMKWYPPTQPSIAISSIRSRKQMFKPAQRQRSPAPPSGGVIWSNHCQIVIALISN